MAGLDLELGRVRRPLVRPFAISRGVRTHQEGVMVRLRDGRATGCGETSGLAYAGETPDQVMTVLEALRPEIEAGRVTSAGAAGLAPGGARAALDAAFWDLEAKRSGVPAWRAAGLDAPPGPLISAFTISLDTPDAMRAQAEEEAWRPLLKVKLGATDGQDADRARSVRQGAPGAVLIADANAGWTPEDLPALAGVLADAGYALLEQPLGVGQDAALDARTWPLPLCADESFATLKDADRVRGRYQLVNIKLDKCGGLTDALKVRDWARREGLGVFVGCMLAGVTSLAPAFLLAQDADYVDLDGPLWLTGDVAALEQDPERGLVPPGPQVWG